MTLQDFMIRVNRIWCLAIVLLTCILVSCTPKTEYQKMRKEQLSSGERQDSIFLGVYFGMPSQDFYTQSWELNKKGLIREGMSNTTVYYDLEGLPYPAALEYYPVFKDEKVQAVTGHVYYKAWAPWNRDMWADTLIEDIRNFFEGWYGKGFIPVISPGRGKAFAKIDGNRQILLYYTKDERVDFVFTDLTNDEGIIKVDSKK